MKTLILNTLGLMMLLTTNAFGFVEDRTFDSEVVASHSKSGLTLTLLDQKTQQTVVAKVAAETGLTTQQASKVVPLIVNSLIKNVLKNRVVSLVGFGSFSISKSLHNGKHGHLPKQITVGDELPSGIKILFTLDPTATYISIGTSADILEFKAIGVPGSLISIILREDEILASKAAEVIAQTIGNIIAVELDAGFSNGQDARMDASFSNKSGIVFILDSGMAGDNVAHADSCNVDIYDAVDAIESNDNFTIYAWSDSSGYFDHYQEGKAAIDTRQLYQSYDCLMLPGNSVKYLSEPSQSTTHWNGVDKPPSGIIAWPDGDLNGTK